MEGLGRTHTVGEGSYMLLVCMDVERDLRVRDVHERLARCVAIAEILLYICYL